MKFTCTQQILSKALNIVSKAVSSRTTIPILKGILIEAQNDGTVRLAASDLDISIEKIIDAEVEKAGSIVVSAKLFGDIIRKLPSGNIVIEVKDGNAVYINSSSSEFNILGISPEEFPSFGEIEEDSETIIFDKEVFKEMIRKTSFAASIDETKGIIVGVLIEVDEESTNMVALDGFRVAIKREDMKNNGKKNIVIAAKIINELGKIISDIDDEGNLELIVGKKKASAVLPGTKVVMRILDGEYLRYRDIIPKESKIKIKINRSDFLNGIERASLLAKEGKNNRVRLKLEDNKMIISSRSEEGNLREEVSILKDGEDLEIGFNSKYISDVIKSIDDEEIKIEFNSNVNPCIIRPLEGNDYEYLILPLRLTSNF